MNPLAFFLPVKAGGKESNVTINMDSSGALVFWSISGFSMQRAQLHQELAALGLAGAAERDPGIPACVTAALAIKPPEGYAIKREAPEEVVLLRYSGEDATGKLVAHECGRLAWTRQASQLPIAPVATSIVTGDDPARHILGQIRARAERHATRADGADISRVLIRALQGNAKDPMLCGITLKKGGGVYFVPDLKVPQLRQVQAWLAPHGVRVEALEVAPSDRAAVARTAEEAFADDLAELLASITELQAEAAAEGKEIHLKAANARRDQLQQLQTRLELWTGVMGGVTAKLAAGIAQVEAELGNLPTESLSARREPPKAPKAKKTPKAPEPEEQPDSGVYWVFTKDRIPDMVPATILRGLGERVHAVATAEAVGLLVPQHPIFSEALLVVWKDGVRASYDLPFSYSGDMMGGEEQTILKIFQDALEQKRDAA